MILEDNINYQYIELWNELNSLFNFKLVYSKDEISWRVNTALNPIEIYTSSKTPDIASFTHELLHVYIEHKGMSSDHDILNSMYGDASFQILTTNALFARIHNYCSHTKMFPYFKKMGFDENLFIKDRIKFSKSSYYVLKLMFKFKQTLKFAVTDYIGHSMALFNDHESSNSKNTLRSLQKLKNMNPSLFIIIEDFNNEWKNSEDLNLAYYFEKFDANLNDWLLKNVIL